MWVTWHRLRMCPMQSMVSVLPKAQGLPYVWSDSVLKSIQDLKNSSEHSKGDLLTCHMCFFLWILGRHHSSMNAHESCRWILGESKQLSLKTSTEPRSVWKKQGVWHHWSMEWPKLMSWKSCWDEWWVSKLELLKKRGSAIFWSVPPLRAYAFFNKHLGSK